MAQAIASVYAGAARVAAAGGAPLREVVHDGARRNARPLQEANGRGVSVYYCWPNA
uniref:Uncharacterized protein n=1 Tax=Oryza glumipatula TaxID=40148 RepID=A0A0E0ABS1_9ORYZ